MPRRKPKDPLAEFQPLFDFLYTPLTERNYRALLLGVCPLFWRELEQPPEFPSVGFKDGQPAFGNVLKLAQNLRAELDEILKTENAYERTPAFSWETILRVPMMNLAKVMVRTRSGSGYLPLKRCAVCSRPFTTHAKRSKQTCHRAQCERAYRASARKVSREKYRQGTSRGQF